MKKSGQIFKYLTAFTYLAKDSSLDKNQMNFIPNDWNDYKGNYDFKLIKVEKFESGEQDEKT